MTLHLLFLVESDPQQSRRWRRQSHGRRRGMIEADRRRNGDHVTREPRAAVGIHSERPGTWAVASLVESDGTKSGPGQFVYQGLPSDGCLGKAMEHIYALALVVAEFGDAGTELHATRSNAHKAFARRIEQRKVLSNLSLQAGQVGPKNSRSTAYAAATGGEKPQPISRTVRKRFIAFDVITEAPSSDTASWRAVSERREPHHRRTSSPHSSGCPVMAPSGRSKQAVVTSASDPKRTCALSSFCVHISVALQAADKRLPFCSATMAIETGCSA